MARRSIKDINREYWVEGDGLVLIEKWASEGLFDKQIAHNIGITPKTLCMWKNEFKEVRDVFKRARGVAIIELINATFNSAKGYYVNEQMLDASGKKKIVKKWVAPNTSAQIFLLKNWMPQSYRERQEVDVKGDIKTNNPYAGLTTEELRKLAERDDN